MNPTPILRQMKKREYLLTSEDARKLLQTGEGSASISLDLNLSTTEVLLTRGKLVLPGGLEVPAEKLGEIARKRKRVFALREGAAAEPLEIVGKHYYKLSPTAGAPTIEIDGVQMHRTSGIDPFEDSKLKVQGTVRNGDAVLDTCGGLGYTAIWAVRMGASRVVSVEVSPEVRELRARNPWSRELSSSPVELVSADCFEHVRSLPGESFDSVVHDPPRFSLAGELYGAEFYSQLFRVLKPGGRLFHYTGAPYSRRGRRDFPSEVAGRLSQAGLRVRHQAEKLGVSARK